MKELDLGYSTGRDRLLLRLPVVVRHLVDDDSPLSRWQSGPSGIGEDADSEIIVVVSPSRAGADCFQPCAQPQMPCLVAQQDWLLQLLNWFAAVASISGCGLSRKKNLVSLSGLQKA